VATAEAHCCYLTTLFFHSLSNKSHRELKKKVHNDALTGSDTVPRTYDKVPQLADQYKSLYQPHPARVGGGGVAFAQKGKAGGSTIASTPLVASAKKSLERKPNPVPGKKDDDSKMETNASGKKNCFNCRAADQWVVNCTNLTTAQRKELAVMAHISIGKDILDRIGFLQNNAAVVVTCKTLNPHRLYLDSTSSFHQVLSKEHFDHLNMAGVTLCANYNAGANFATKKGWYQALFHLWLVATTLPISYPSPNWKTMVSPSVNTLEANGLSLPPKAKTSPSTANQTECAAAFPTSTCGPHRPWQCFKPSASATKASQNARYAMP
jgi:hypothetical protein